MNNDLKVIKKKYGEAMMHFCRKSFPTILNEENVLLSILLNNFYPDKDLYSDIVNLGIENEFINYINSLYNPEYVQELLMCNKTPKEIFEEIGYDFYECNSNEDIRSFRKYYAPDEELCSFNEDRISRCYVFFAIRKDIDKIKRQDFLFPKRQDEYGVSALSIQFTKDNNYTLSIKNRYNHIVDNADATYNNNLDNVYPGLTYSFAKTYGLRENISKNNDFKIEGYIKANNGKYYKYNYMLSNIYYCNNNIIIDNGVVKEFEHEKYIVTDIYIIDLVKKEICLYDDNLSDSFPSLFEGVLDIKINKLIDEKELLIYLKDSTYFYLKLDRNNNIIEIRNEFIKVLPENFMFINNRLKKVIFPNLVEIRDMVFWLNKTIEEIDIRNVRVIGNNVLPCNEKLKKIDIDLVQSIGNNFLKNNIVLEEISVNSLVTVEDNFLYSNLFLKRIYLPNLEYVGDQFLASNVELSEIYIPSLKEANRHFLSQNKGIKFIYLPNLSGAYSNFLISNKDVVVEAPNILFIEDVNNTCLDKYIKKINENNKFIK